MYQSGSNILAIEVFMSNRIQKIECDLKGSLRYAPSVQVLLDPVCIYRFTQDSNRDNTEVCLSAVEM
jgi:hypothetical protein